MVRYLLKTYNSDHSLKTEWAESDPVFEFFKVWALNDIKKEDCINPKANPKSDCKDSLVGSLDIDCINLKVIQCIQNLLNGKITDSNDYLLIDHIIFYMCAHNFTNYKFVFYKEYENIVYKYIYTDSVLFAVLKISKLEELSQSETDLNETYNTVSDIKSEITVLKEMDYNFFNLCKYYKY